MSSLFEAWVTLASGKTQNKALGTDCFIISGLGGVNKKPAYVFETRSCILNIPSFVLNIPSSKKAFIDLSTRVSTMGCRASSLFSYKEGARILLSTPSGILFEIICIYRSSVPQSFLK